MYSGESFAIFSEYFLLITIIYLSYFPLSDIQEFYELTLLDDSKSIQQKTAETLQIATKWEKDGQATKIADVSRIEDIVVCICSIVYRNRSQLYRLI